MSLIASKLALPAVVAAQGVLPGAPEGVFPGIMDQVSSGVDITAGDLVQRNQVFVWTWDFDWSMPWEGVTYKYPDQMTIHVKDGCDSSMSSESTIATSFAESMTNQAGQWGGGVEAKLDVGIDGLEASFQNSMSFSNSHTSRDYEKQSSYGRSLAASLRVRAHSYQTQVHHQGITDEAFHPYFKMEVKDFAANPTKEQAFQFFDQYGTHFVQAAEVGGEAYRDMFFSSGMDTTVAEHYKQKTKSSGFKFLWFNGGSSHEEETDVKDFESSAFSVFNSDTHIVGGDSRAKDQGEWCESLKGGSHNPVITTYFKMVPLWDYFDRIDGVNATVGDQMKSHFMDLVKNGRQCATTCQTWEPDSICSWQPDTRTWDSTHCQVPKVASGSSVYLSSVYWGYHLDTNGRGFCGANPADMEDVVVHTNLNRTAASSTTWTVVRHSGEGPLAHGDLVHLQNQASPGDEKKYLSTCGHVDCGDGFNVVTSQWSPNSSGDDWAGTWMVMKQHGDGHVAHGDRVYLQNQNDHNRGRYLDVCGHPVKGEGYNVVASPTKDRDGPSGLWVIHLVDQPGADGLIADEGGDEGSSAVFV